MVNLVLVTESTQNGNGVLDSRLGAENLLEPSFKGGILFYIFAVFVKGCGSDYVHVAAGKSRLKEVSRIHASFRSTCADNRVELVDEQDYLAIAL